MAIGMRFRITVFKSKIVNRTSKNRKSNWLKLNLPISAKVVATSRQNGWENAPLAENGIPLSKRL
jgi:hypothetical protein